MPIAHAHVSECVCYGGAARRRPEEDGRSGQIDGGNNIACHRVPVLAGERASARVTRTHEHRFMAHCSLDAIGDGLGRRRRRRRAVTLPRSTDALMHAGACACVRSCMR